MNHQFWITQIKNKTGASFVGWENSTVDGLRLKIKFGKEEPQYVKLEGRGGIDNVNTSTYLKLLQQL